MAGYSYGRIASSYVAGGSVVGGRGVGGLTGRLNAGTVVASYSDVSVNAGDRPMGGLAGGMDGMSVVSASYSIGRVQRSGAEYGGLTGVRGSGAEIQSSYFDRARSGQSSCCGTNAPSPDETPRTSFELRSPTTAAGIYAGWHRLNVDGVDQLGDGDLNDDAPWDFGSGLDYPVLRGVSARTLAGNTTNAGVQRRVQPAGAGNVVAARHRPDNGRFDGKVRGGTGRSQHGRGDGTLVGGTRRRRRRLRRSGRF